MAISSLMKRERAWCFIYYIPACVLVSLWYSSWLHRLICHMWNIRTIFTSGLFYRHCPSVNVAIFWKFHLYIAYKQKNYTMYRFPNIHNFDWSFVVIHHSCPITVWIQPKFCALFLCVTCLTKYTIPNLVWIFNVYLQKSTETQLYMLAY